MHPIYPATLFLLLFAKLTFVETHVLQTSTQRNKTNVSFPDNSKIFI